MPRSKGLAMDLLQLLQGIPSRGGKDALHYALPTNADQPSQLLPHELEQLAVFVYSHLGYRNVKHTGVHSSTDGGVDVWMLSPSGMVEIVQCKQLKGHVGRPELISFSRVMRQQHAVIGRYWAPGGFSEPALKYAFLNAIELCTDLKIRELTEQAVVNAQRALAHLPPIKKAEWKWWQVLLIVYLIVIIFGLICLFGYLVAFGR